MEKKKIKVISSKVCEVMEDIGVTEEMVNFRRHIYLKTEKRFPHENEPSFTPIHTVGSQVEGSTTLGMNSDTDMIAVALYMGVILHASK
ncbi:hypothetical protein DPMN_103093 [Dreissena polymorpha]|uniref:Uncharacterized protein n=1 Tax=Dreissena polymorpha TaxID=45954 RepID=A0A9D4K2I8_DREPO|nr:hypothetical protein DPMN_103093 [Dreissena polymorpha]